jgi:hypothetical protein
MARATYIFHSLLLTYCYGPSTVTALPLTGMLSLKVPNILILPCPAGSVSFASDTSLWWIHLPSFLQRLLPLIYIPWSDKWVLYRNTFWLQGGIVFKLKAWNFIHDSRTMGPIQSFVFQSHAHYPPTHYSDVVWFIYFTSRHSLCAMGAFPVGSIAYFEKGWLHYLLNPHIPIAKSFQSLFSLEGCDYWHTSFLYWIVNK